MTRTVTHCLWTTLAVISIVNCVKTNVDPRKDDPTTEAPAPKMDQGMKDQEVSMESRAVYDLMGVMNDCNDTFRVEMSYLVALQESGSFPDETDKTPKCYLRCVLENLDIASPAGDFDPERTAMIITGMRNGTTIQDNTEIATSCAERSETCKCERSYNYLKCVMSMEIQKYDMNS